MFLLRIENHICYIFDITRPIIFPVFQFTQITLVYRFQNNINYTKNLIILTYQ